MKFRRYRELFLNNHYHSPGLDPDDLGQRGSLFLFFQIVQYIWHYCARIDVESPSYVYETQKNEQTTVREEKFSLLPF